MAEPPSRSAKLTRLKAIKDKKCEFCHTSFTSSSLGRHHDQWIKDKNPKAPDEQHNAEAIAKIREKRGSVTRRQPKGSLSRQGTSVSVLSKKSSGSDAESPSLLQSPVSARGGSDRATMGREYPFNTSWEATGVINGASMDDRDAGHSPRNRRPTLPPGWRAATSDVDNKDQKTQDLEDRARATELALRELIGSFRTAKKHIDMDSTPFDFDPLELDFPALVLQCLEAPAALFASMPTRTVASWSLNPPGHNELAALKGYFQEAFRRWKITCAAATTAISEDLVYPPSESLPKPDPIEAIRRAEEKAEEQEKRVGMHIVSTYNGWAGIPEAQREHFWRLELARSVWKKQKQIEKLKGVEHTLRQQNEHLKAQVQSLSRLQHPREFKIVPPTTIPFDPRLVSYLAEESVVHNKGGVGLTLEDRHSDLDTIVSRSIERWKNVVVSTRPENHSSQNPQQASRANTGRPETGATVNTTANVSTNQVQRQVQDQGQAKPPQPHPLQQQRAQQQAQQPLPPPQHVQQQAQHPPPQLQQVHQQAQQELRLPNSPTVSPAEQGSAEYDDDDESSDGEADEDADGDSDADADGDAEMDDASAYNSTLAAPPTAFPPQQHQQQHLPLPQQQHQQTNPLGPVRTRPSGTQGRFNPLQSNNPTGRSVTGATNQTLHGGNNNNMHIMGRSVGVGGNDNMAALGGVHPQYLNNAHMGGIGPSQGGGLGGVGHTMGIMEEVSQRMGVGGVTPQGGGQDGMFES